MHSSIYLLLLIVVPLAGALGAALDLEDRTVELAERNGFSVPKGVRHRPRAPERTVILMAEGAGVVPTGD